MRHAGHVKQALPGAGGPVQGRGPRLHPAAALHRQCSRGRGAASGLTQRVSVHSCDVMMHLLVPVEAGFDTSWVLQELCQSTVDL